MKRSIVFSFLFMILLAACSPSRSGAECKDGFCVSIILETSVQASEPVPFSILVKSEKDVSGLGISLYGDSSITIVDAEEKPAEAQVIYQDKRSIDWKIDAKGGEEYKFSGHVIFPKPSASYGVFSWGLIAAAGHPSMGRVTDSVTIYMDPSGKQVEDSEAKMLLQTDYPAPTPPPDLTIVPDTPMPTVAWPSATPLPSPSPTLPAYPPLGEGIDNESVNNQPSQTITQPAYPIP
jgi:hypothetical protein